MVIVQHARGLSWTAILLVVVVLSGSATALAEAPISADGATCGRPGQPRCPMQSWMRARLAVPAAQGKLDGVADALTALAGASPDPSWTLWRKSSTDGAAAARGGDAAGTRQACRTCHEAYRRDFRARHRLRPAPP